MGTGKVYAEGETDSSAWEIRGEPTVRILSDHLATHYTTCGTLLNRIPQLLAAEPGYLTIDSLPQLKYQQSYVGWGQSFTALDSQGQATEVSAH